MFERLGNNGVTNHNFVYDDPGFPKHDRYLIKDQTRQEKYSGETISAGSAGNKSKAPKQLACGQMVDWGNAEAARD
jgi:hypothetical protein